VRRYSIQIEGGTGGPTRNGIYDSQINGANNPGALNVELDISVISYDLPSGAALVRIWGISLADISQAANNNNKNIKVFAGFGPGLPLANPAQYGLILQGYVFQAYGNWIMNSQTLDLIVLAGSAPASGTAQGAPVNLSLNWPSGTSLSDAIKQTLTTAYPGYTANINISPNLKFSGDLPGSYQNLKQFSTYIRQVSKSILNNPSYPGVSLTLQGKTFTVFDGTQAASSSPRAIAFQDLVSQPTWINAPSIQFRTAMRADLKVGDNVILPKTQVTNSAAAQTSLVNQNVAFQGTFQISVMRHVGNSRQSDAASWVTVFDAFPQQQAAA
jgi:hypothetical protein